MIICQVIQQKDYEPIAKYVNSMPISAYIYIMEKGMGKANSNERHLLTKCMEHDLIITNTLFYQKNMRKMLCEPIIVMYICVHCNLWDNVVTSFWRLLQGVCGLLLYLPPWQSSSDGTYINHVVCQMLLFLCSWIFFLLLTGSYLGWWSVLAYCCQVPHL